MSRSQTARYYYDHQGRTIEKGIELIADDGVDVRLFADDSDRDGSFDRTFPWSQFERLVGSIEQSQYGDARPNFTEHVFVGGRHGPAMVGRQAGVELETSLGAVPVPGEDQYHHLYYGIPEEVTNRPNEGRLSLRRVQGDNGSFPDNIGSPAGDRFGWELRDHELQMLLVEDPEPSRYPVVETEGPGHGVLQADQGFEPSLRRALFVDRYESVVEQHI